jgi:hypothetical protein
MLVASICLLCAILSIFYLAPALLFLFNGKEVVVSLGDVISFSVIPQVVLLALGLVVALLGGQAARIRVATSCAALALLVYLQGNLLAWDYGRFDGSEIDWEQHQFVGLVEISVWLCILVASQVFTPRLVALAPRVALLAVALQLFSIGAEVAAGRNWEHATSTGIDPNLYHFSEEQNVLVLVLDGFQSHSFDAILRESPDLERDLEGFVYFRDTLSVFPTTLMSVPAILSGEIYDNSKPTREFIEQALAGTSLPDVLAAKGFSSSMVSQALYCQYFLHSSCTEQLEIQTEDLQTLRRRDAVKIWDVTLFRHVPHPLKRMVYRDHQWLLGRTLVKPEKEHRDYLHAPLDDSRKYWGKDRQQASGLLWSMLYRNADAKSRSRTFKLLHFWNSHSPYVVDRSCELLDRRRYRSTSERLRNLDQSRCTLAAALKLVRVLKNLGVFDRTLLVIMADHGSPTRFVPLRGPEKVDVNRAFPLLLVKPLESGAPFEISDRPVSLADLPHTLAELLGMDHEYPGQVLFESAEGRERRYLHYRWKHRYWQAQYLPSIQEYRVEGDGRNPAAWRKGRLLKPAAP